MTKLCNSCKEEIPEGRLKALPNATVCVNCSTSRMKRSITVVGGEKEDIFNDIVILEAEDYERYFGPDKPSKSLFDDSEQ